MSQSSESKIDRLRKRLNSQNQPSAEYNEGRLSRSDGDDIPDRWEHDDDDGGYPPPQKPADDSSGGSFLNKLLIFSGIFFVLAFGFAVYSVGLDGTGVSPDNVSIEIDGPTSVSAGDTATLNIGITNGNKVLLQDAELVITYPEGTRQPNNAGEDLRRVREGMGVIPAGDTVEYTAESSLFGDEGDKQTISVQLEYQVEDSNAIFTASRDYEVEISESPVSLSIDSPTEVTANESFPIELTVSSNSSQVLDDVVLVADYPFGYSAQEADPEPDYRQYVWKLGDISPGAERDIEVTGAFSDSNASDEQAFRFDVGSARSDDTTAIGTLFASQDITMSLREPYINVDLDLETNPSSGGNKLDVTGRINWSSNLDSIVRGGEITATLSGSGIDYETVESRDGLYRSGDQQIVWNPRTNNELTDISPGDDGSLRFSFSTNDSQTLVNVADNPSVDIAVEMQAQSPDSSSLPNPVTTNIERTVRLPSVVGLTADTLYDDGPFTNTGPVPPEVEEDTTYTLHLSVSNTTNEITNTSFQAALPAYVEIDGNPSPSGANFDYSDVSGRLTWNIGTIPAGAGYTEASQEIFIPVRLTPSSSHAGSVLPLLEDLSITGTDSFTEESVQVRGIDPPTTELDDLRAGTDTGSVED